jgi:hypothetical protein
MDIRRYYLDQLQWLETPEFVQWFEAVYGDESPFKPDDHKLLEMYWSERRFALLGWHAAHLPASISRDKIAFVQSIRLWV